MPSPEPRTPATDADGAGPEADDAEFEAALREREEPQRAERLRVLATALAGRSSGGAGPLDLPTAEDRHAALDALLRLAEHRGSAPVAVRAWNPARALADAADAERGYPARGAVIETASRDLPFLVDTVEETLRARGLRLHRVRHPIVGVRRGADGGLLALADALEARDRESLIHVELEAPLEAAELAEVEDVVRRALDAVGAVVADHEPMVERLREMAEAVEERGPGDAAQADGSTQAAGHRDDEAAREEAAAFLRWLQDEHLIVLGARDYRPGPEGLVVDGAPGLGLLRDPAGSSFATPRDPAGLPAPVRDVLDGRANLVVGKTNAVSPVHRLVRMDDVSVLLPDGRLRRIVGLLTTRAYAGQASTTPLLRRTLRRVLEHEGLIPGSHDWKALTALFDRFPKDAVLAAPAEELGPALVALLDLSGGAFRLLGGRSADGRAAALVAAVPREAYDARTREEIVGLLRERFDEPTTVDAEEVLGSGDHVHLHVRLHDAAGLPDVDVAALEPAAEAIAASWERQLRGALAERHGTERADVLLARWASRLPRSYRAGGDPRTAAAHVELLEGLHGGRDDLLVGLHEADGADGEPLTRVVVARRGRRSDLSEVLPVLEDLGLRVVEERPARVREPRAGTRPPADLWVQDFGTLGPDGPVDLDAAGERIAALLRAVWAGETESDALNRLVVTTALDHHRIEPLRAYRRHRQRLGSRFTERFQNDVVAKHGEITERLVRLFELRFGPPATDGVTAPRFASEPVTSARDEAAEEGLRHEILERLDAVEALDEDLILRNQLQMLDATVRTNAFRPGRGAIALKLRGDDIPASAQPAPRWEVYVSAPEVEGVHLRGGDIARGGIRWSDREDFRTEVHGLMTAQLVKNAVIVPTGAKGGFHLRHAIPDGTTPIDAARKGYRAFIRALLDVTDDRAPDGSVVHPDGVRVLDGEDPYLVVAADKGTATFSDTANAIAEERGFWLGDAFASGGSAGYDHKVLGITARGAWESVRRHFHEVGTDPEADPITVVGIGDMSGDVFGNGLLLSRTLGLVAAYDHRHVFLDPHPQDPEAAWTERKRLFDTPGSTWDDYDRGLLSPGGGVFPRTAKTVRLEEPAREALGIDREELPPDELIRAVLRAPVDLLFNGGIGTVVKASHEGDADARDRASDGIRVDGRDLRCRVVGEGGNLGLTQAGRLEYARLGGPEGRGGAINADFVDNSAGVDCSDHEVNIKILLGIAEARGELERPERDRIMREATDDVVGHVLGDSFRQAKIVTQEQRRSAAWLYAYEDLMDDAERGGLLDRESELLPAGDELGERRAAGRGLERPELAILVAYAKRALTDALQDDPLLDDDVFAGDLREYFPAGVLAGREGLLGEFPLRRELLATVVANDTVDQLGPTIVARHVVERGCSAGEVVRAYRIARATIGAPEHWRAIDRERGVGAAVQWRLTDAVDGLVRGMLRWHLLHRADATIGEVAERERAAYEELRSVLPRTADPETAAAWEAEADELEGLGVPTDLARVHPLLAHLHHAPAIADVAWWAKRPVAEVAAVDTALGGELDLDRLELVTARLPVSARVQRWAMQAVRDDLLQARRDLLELAVREGGPDVTAADAVAGLVARRERAVERLRRLSSSLIGDRAPDLAALTLAVRELRDIVG